MTQISPKAGHTLPPEELTNIQALQDAYYARIPEPGDAAQRVSFGTSGHRGTSIHGSFNETHIAAIAEAICRYRASEGITGPLFVGIDSHALSALAQKTVIEVMAAHNVAIHIDAHDRLTPTPVISHTIIVHNADESAPRADGIVITPSHNPPSDGGIKYNAPHGGPADTKATGQIQDMANQFMSAGLKDVKRLPYDAARTARCVKTFDFVAPYVNALGSVIDMDAIRAAEISIGIDPLGGASLDYWQAIIERFGINATIVSRELDPQFGFMTADWDGKIRMDCSSPYAMARLINMAGQFDIAFANDPDADRHGIVCRPSGLMNPNHYLAVAIWYLFQNRPDWPENCKIGKTLVSSALIDRVGQKLGRAIIETPVGFKWFVAGMASSSLGFAGEESAGASFLDREGKAWSTDKDGIILCLLAAEITAKTGRTPGEIYADLTRELGAPFYARIDAPADPDQKRILGALKAEQYAETTLAGDPIIAKLTHAPGNNAPIGGLKISTAQGWFAARPSGTENVYKIYAESFVSEAHLKQIQDEAQEAIAGIFKAGVSVP
ncbi:Phosphoglucomutase [Acetobacteraceae bacterium EV16G]|uniref:Phosphoglucomutase n=1 Tax=Sorlinia euscelidii TaxID=3081148 RepID=A0ABU7U081_9PROT